ncbi:MAG: hypothetical protein N2484_16215 [Clostridia bacterium]|nr:hypothetical protein [Clostridia bacterium]
MVHPAKYEVKKDKTMKRKLSLNFTLIIYILFVIYTILVLFGVYKDVRHPLAYNIGMGYLLFALLLLAYTIVKAVNNTRKLKLREIWKRLLKFLILFVSFGMLNLIIDHVFKPDRIDLFKNFSISLGMSLGIVFWDLIFSKKKED